MAARLPDNGSKIKIQLARLQKILAECDQAALTSKLTDLSLDSKPTITTETEESDKKPVVTKFAGEKSSVSTSHSIGLPRQAENRMLLTENQRLPPHVIREMYASRAPDDRLYGGRMTDQRLQMVSSLTTEAIETLHR